MGTWSDVLQIGSISASLLAASLQVLEAVEYFKLLHEVKCTFSSLGSVWPTGTGQLIVNSSVVLTTCLLATFSICLTATRLICVFACKQSVWSAFEFMNSSHRCVDL